MKERIGSESNLQTQRLKLNSFQDGKSNFLNSFSPLLLFNERMENVDGVLLDYITGGENTI